MTAGSALTYDLWTSYDDGSPGVRVDYFLDPWLDPATVTFTMGNIGTVYAGQPNSISWYSPTSCHFQFTVNVLSGAPFGTQICSWGQIIYGPSPSCSFGGPVFYGTYLCVWVQ